MAEWTCDVCGESFDTPSERDRHERTSHPKQALSAADLERALTGVDYPARPEALAAYARDRGEDEAAAVLEKLRDRPYADAADVARAFGELRSREKKPEDKPSVKGGRASPDPPSGGS